MANTADRVTRVAADLTTARPPRARDRAARPSSSSTTGRGWDARYRVSRRQPGGGSRPRWPAIWNARTERRRGAVFNAEIAAAIQEKLAGSNYGTTLARRGITTVALDENGDIVEHRPDGSSVVLTKKRRAPRRKKASATPSR